MTFKYEPKEHEVFPALNSYRNVCHGTSSKAGWWQDVDLVCRQEIPGFVKTMLVQATVATKFALIHSEISEALEGYRKDKKDDHLPDLPSVDVELADALIRIFDLAGYLGCDLSTAVERKMQYNKTRADHTVEARQAPGGKRF